MTQSIQQVGVMLMTYGSPATLDDIPVYLRHVYGGREANEEVIAEFRRRYDLIGGSPLLRITREQAAALQEELNAQHPHGPTFRVDAGMRFAPPFVADLVPELANGAHMLVGIIMSPQYSPIIMSGYVRTLEEAVASLQRDDLTLTISRDWHMQPYFLQALAERVRQALDRFPPDVRERVPVLLTAHSMPKRVVQNEPDYINDLKETAAAIAQMVGSADSPDVLLPECGSYARRMAQTRLRRCHAGATRRRSYPCADRACPIPGGSP